MQILIEVVYALPERQQLKTLNLPAGTCAREALRRVLADGLVVLDAADAKLATAELPLGVYGQSVHDDYVMKNGDRLEIYRPLLQDPKERRRQVAGRQKSSIGASPSPFSQK